MKSRAAKTAKASTVNNHLLRAYLSRKAAEQQTVIDNVRVFSRRYDAAVEELEEIENLLQQVP